MSSPLVFILAGQSDMVGRGEPEKLPEEMERMSPDIDFLMSYDIDRNALEGSNSTSGGKFVRLSRECQWSGAGQRYSHGPEWGIAKALVPLLGGLVGEDEKSTADRQKRKIYLIKFAMGSTTLHEDWRPDSERSYFSGFVEYVREMVKEVERLEMDSEGRNDVMISSLFWLQGHSDASGRAEMRDNYGKNFVDFVKRVREELGEMLVVTSQLTWQCRAESKSDKKFRKQMQKVNEQVKDACRERIQNCFYSSYTEDEEANMTCLEDGHCDTGGLLLLGELMGRTFVEAYGSSSTNCCPGPESCLNSYTCST